MEVPDIFEIENNSHLSSLYFKKRYPDFYDYLLHTFSNTKTFSEKVYLYVNKMKDPPVCPCCNKNKRIFLSYFKGYGKYCGSKCANNSQEHHEKTKITCNEKYGGIGFASREIARKTKSTILERYGVEHFRNEEKIKKTCREKYGADYCMGTNYFHEKSEQTCLKKYGVDHISKFPEIIEKTKKTKLEKYGDGSYCNRETATQTCLKKYGVKFPFQSEDIQNKCKLTLKEKYGGHALYDGNILKKCINHKKDSFIKSHPDIIDINQGEKGYIYKCICPHIDCNKCTNKTFDIPSTKYLYRKYTNRELCTVLNSMDEGKSSGTSIECFVRNILDEYNIIYETNVRSILWPEEVDVYVPSCKLAIECNGIYWHSLKDKTYHYNKFKRCADKNILLLNIWEDWIITKPDQIRSILLNLLGIYEESNTGLNICLKEISRDEYNSFININSLFSNTSGDVYVGAFSNNNIIGSVAFSSENNNWIITGYGFKNVSIQDELFKSILNYFINHYKYQNINYVTHNDICENILFEKCGFVKCNTNKKYIRTYYVNQKYERLTSRHGRSKKYFKISDSGGYLMSLNFETSK